MELPNFIATVDQQKVMFGVQVVKLIILGKLTPGQFVDRRSKVVKELSVTIQALSKVRHRHHHCGSMYL